MGRSMERLSKTARQAVQAGDGVVKRVIVAWGYYRKSAGGIHGHPDRTFYVMEEAQAWQERVGGDGYLIRVEELSKNTVRR